MGDLEDWLTDSDVEDYLVNLQVPGEYRDAGRPVVCDVVKTFAKTNIEGDT